MPIDGEYVKEAKIGRAIMDADIIISLTHFKGHGGNRILAVPLRTWAWAAAPGPARWRCTMPASRLYIRISVLAAAPVRETCAHGAITVLERKASIDTNKCVGCGRCIGACPVDAVDSMCDEANDILNRKIAEYTLAVLKDRPNFHVSLVVDVSPNCDCHSENDAPIVA
ncbi:MAG: DUF362 domain-containing protein [Enterocloster clostridioformis]